MAVNRNPITAVASVTIPKVFHVTEPSKNVFSHLSDYISSMKPIPYDGMYGATPIKFSKTHSSNQPMINGIMAKQSSVMRTPENKNNLHNQNFQLAT